MFDSPKSAQPHTMRGWKSRDGYFYPNEHSARYAGCTHRPCQRCSAPAEKLYGLCATCRNQNDESRYLEMAEGEWDGVAMLYSDARDEYFVDLDAAEDALNEGQTLSDLRLVICEQNYCRQIDVDYFVDELAEDSELPEEMHDAMEEFNRRVTGIALSWSPGRFRLKLEAQPATEGIQA